MKGIRLLYICLTGSEWESVTDTDSDDDIQKPHGSKSKVCHSQNQYTYLRLLAYVLRTP